MTTPGVTNGRALLLAVAAWLESPAIGDWWAQTHGATLAKHIREEMLTRPDPKWELPDFAALDDVDGRKALINWIWRNEHGPAFCSPPWTRNFSFAVGFALAHDGLGRPIPSELPSYDDRNAYNMAQQAYESLRVADKVQP